MEQGCNVFNSCNILSHNPNTLWDLGHFMSISSACFYSLCLPSLNFKTAYIILIKSLLLISCVPVDVHILVHVNWVECALRTHTTLSQLALFPQGWHVEFIIPSFYFVNLECASMHACMHTHVVLIP